MLKGILTAAVFLAALIMAPWGRGEMAAEESITAMSYNIRYGTANDGDDAWPKRKDLCIGVLKARDADIIGLQEALSFQLDEINEAMPGYALIGVGRDDGLRKGEYAPLLIRTDRYAIAESGTRWLSDTPDVPGSKSWGNGITRICTFARLIDLRNAEAIWVYNLHLDHQSQPARASSAELVAAMIAERPNQDEPVIVMGDMNAGEANPTLRYLRGEIETASGRTEAPTSPQLIDTYRAIHRDAEQVGTFNGFRDARNGEKIDHLLASKGIQVLDADIDRTRGDGGHCPSDHDAVWAVLVPNG